MILVKISLIKKYLFNLNKCHLCPVSKDINHRCDIYDNFIEEELTSNKKEKEIWCNYSFNGITRFK